MLKKLIVGMLFATAPAIAQETLTVYTYDSFAADWGPGPDIKKAFEKECDCVLKMVAMEDGVSLLNRLRMEGKNSPADVILGLDNNLIAAAEKTGLFTKHNVNTASLSVPVTWDNSYFLPYDYGYFAFIYNSEKLKNPPTSFQELVDSTEPLKIIYQDPRTSTPGLGLLLWVQKVFGDNAPQAWKKISTKTLTVTKGWSESYGLFLKGEADMVLSYTSSPAYHIIEDKDPRYKAASFSEGHYIQVEVAGQLASSQHPELANRFMTFILSKSFQDVIPVRNWMYPVIKQALPSSYNELVVPAKALEFTAQEVNEKRSIWIRSWQSALSK